MTTATRREQWMNFREKASTLWGTESVPFITAYVVSGLLCLIIPAAKYRNSVNSYRNSYYYQYQQQNQSGDNGRGEYDVNNCKWWQWRCESLWVNENGEYVNQNNNNNGQNGQNGEQYYSVPSWFSGWGGGNRSGDRRSADGGSANSASLKFVYAWQVLILLALLAFGASTVYKFRPSNGASPDASRMALQSLFIVQFIFTNTTWMAMWMLANGSINVEGREIEELGGFYNQFSVMMFITNFWLTLWGTIFCVFIGYHTCKTPRTPEQASSSYLPYTEPSSVAATAGADNTTKKPSGGLFVM